MADLITRIIADDKQFNDKIERSKKQTKQFSVVGKLAQGALLKMAGAFGIAATATEAFRKIIDSTQGNTDRFKSVMEQAKAGVDFFFDSVAMGDFSNMLKGFDNAIARARKLYDAMDTLGDMQAGWTDVENEYRTKINENIAAIYDTNTPLADRKAMIEENKKYIALLEKKSKGIVAQTAAAVVATARREAQMDNVTEADVKRYLQGISMHDDAEFYGYLDKRAELARKSKETVSTTMSGNWGTTTTATPTQDAILAQKQLESLKANNTEMEKYYRINELISDTKRTEIVQLRQQGRAIESNIASLKRQQATVERRYGKERGGEGSPKVDIVPTGSIAELEKQISTARKNFLNATTDEARRSADELIKVLEAKKAFIEIGFKYPGGVGNIKPVGKFANIDSKFTDLDGKINLPHIDMNDKIKPFGEVSSYSDYVRQVAEQNANLIDSFTGIGDVMYGMSDILGESAGKWLQWGANVVTTAGQAIPAILALANASAAKAAADGAGAVAPIPIVGPILAAGAVISIMGALMNIPKFATGGIVPGGSFTGDKMLVRVNSGELILNRAQQNNLAGALQGGASGKVRFEIEGSRLVGILDQESRRRGRR